MNHLISLDGFDYLLNNLSSSGIRQLVESLAPLITQLDPSIEDKKHLQYAAMLNIIDSLPYKARIKEIGCGKGKLSDLIAKNHKESQIQAFDINVNLINKAKSSYNSPNLEYTACDFRNYRGSDCDLAVSLHSCGELSAYVVQYALERKASIVVVPCCYGLLSTNTPKSTTLQYREKEFSSICTSIRATEHAKDKSPHSQYQNDLLKLLYNFDKAFYLQERGYDISFQALTNEFRPNARQSPHRFAIVGQI